MPMLRRKTYGGGNHKWLASTHGTGNAPTGSLNVAAFSAVTHYPDGYIPSGQPVAKVGTLYVPYLAGANEVQTINLGAATAGTVAITFDGETTAAIAYNATAAATQAALEALSNVDAGDIVVTGGPLPGTVTLTFGGQYAGLNVAQVTVTPTGLTGGTVTVSTAAAGGAAVAGADKLDGFLLDDVAVDGGEASPAAILRHGSIVAANVPGTFVAPAFAPGFTFE